MTRVDALQCRFCGGRRCKYENPANFEHLRDTHPAVKGVFSSWVGDDILAMARPTTRAIRTHGLITQFRALRIGAVVNLQMPGEHARCGDGVDAKSGFSYRPERFMEAGIAVYGFGWPDMTTPTLARMLNVVEVMDFTISMRGQRVAVHCHAGLGRTGLAIACYLAYKGACPEDAVAEVRLHRPGSIQTKEQRRFVAHFAAHVAHLRRVFCTPGAQPDSLDEVPRRQSQYLHGAERIRLRFLPKVVNILVTRILALAQREQRAGNKIEEGDGSVLAAEDARVSECGATHARLRVACEEGATALAALRRAADADAWEAFARAKDAWILLALLLAWLRELRVPVVSSATLLRISEAVAGADGRKGPGNGPRSASASAPAAAAAPAEASLLNALAPGIIATLAEVGRLARGGLPGNAGATTLGFMRVVAGALLADDDGCSCCAKGGAGDDVGGEDAAAERTTLALFLVTHARASVAGGTGARSTGGVGAGGASTSGTGVPVRALAEAEPAAAAAKEEEEEEEEEGRVSLRKSASAESLPFLRRWPTRPSSLHLPPKRGAAPSSASSSSSFSPDCSPWGAASRDTAALPDSAEVVPSQSAAAPQVRSEPLILPKIGKTGGGAARSLCKEDRGIAGG